MNSIRNIIHSKRPLLLLAPMAELTHPGFRAQLHSFGGCDIYFTEMISADLLVHGTPFKNYYLMGTPGREQLVYQLMGARKQTLIKAAGILAERGARAVDINMGCSAPDILKKGAGCAMMRRPEQSIETVAAIRTELPPEICLSVKLRLGEKEDKTALTDFAESLQQAGCDFLTLHPKIRKDRMSRPPRWDYVAHLKKVLNIPVFGNGHITSVEDYNRIKKQYSPAGVMIGRGVVQKPWLFRQIKSELDLAAPLREIDLLATTLDHFEKIRTFQPDEFHLSRAQRFSLFFYKNLTFGYRLHDREVQHASSLDQIEESYKMYFQRNSSEQILKLN